MPYLFTRWSARARHCLIALILAASAQPAAPAAPAKRDVFAVIEQGRQALLADKYEEASKAIEEVLKMPEFAEVDSGVQYHVFLFGAFADSGRDDYLGAHEFMVLATEFPEATPENWLMRAQFATWIDAWPDATLAATTVAKRWPKSITKDNSEMIGRIAFRAHEDETHKAEELDLLNALFAGKFQLEFGTQPDGLWYRLIEDAMDRKDLPRARELSTRLQSTPPLLSIRIDRRFDELLKAEPRAFDLPPALERESRRLAKAAAANPRSLDVLVQYGSLLLEQGRFTELLAITGEVIARVTAAKPKSPPYDDIPDHFNWIFNHRAAALRALGRWDEALTVMEAGRLEKEHGSANVSQAINLGWQYCDFGKPQKALDALDGIDWAHSLSPYGRMQLQHVRYRAYLQLANAKEADDVYTYLREHREDAEGTWQLVMVDAQDFDGAAALLISRLHDPRKRNEALGEVQDYKPLPLLPKQAEERARWERLLARADVTAAINEVGRREKQPFYDVPD